MRLPAHCVTAGLKRHSWSATKRKNYPSASIPGDLAKWRHHWRGLACFSRVINPQEEALSAKVSFANQDDEDAA